MTKLRHFPGARTPGWIHWAGTGAWLIFLLNAASTRAADVVSDCSGHLRDIDKALAAYRAEHGSLPAHLSDLCPKHMPLAALNCPADPTPGQPFNAFFPPPWQLKDPARPVSYLYLHANTPSPPLFTDLGAGRDLPEGTTLRERMVKHRKNFGDAIPLVQCHHHPNFRLDLFPGGTIRRGTTPFFETDPRSHPFVLERLEADARQGAAAVAARWSPRAVEDYFLTWLDSPLSPADHGRLASVTNNLHTFIDALPEGDRPPALRLAARFDAAGGRYPRALAAARRSAEGRNGNWEAATRYLIERLEYRAAVRAPAPPIDAYLDCEIQRRNLPGLSVAVVRDGKPVYMKGFGFADLEQRVRATPDTVYRIASMTKTFVATGLMMLVEDGKLSLEDPVTKHLTDAPATWEKITVGHLVTHTGGLGDIWSVPAASRPSELNAANIVKLLAGIPREFTPGDRYHYNHGAVLVGVVIERVTGKPFGQYLKQRVFDPLGMDSTRVDDPRVEITRRARNYGWDDATQKWVEAEPLPANVSSLADGGIISTVEDLAKWDAALYGDSLLKAETRRRMWSPTRLNDGTYASYGCGWQLGDVRGHRWVGHFGAGQTSTRISRFLDQKLTIIALCNFDRGDAGKIVDDLATLLLPPAPATKDPDPESTGRVKNVVLSLGAGRADPAAFADAPPATSDLEATASFYKSLGALKAFSFVSEDVPMATGTTRRFAAEFERGRWLHHVSLDRSGKIVSLMLQPE